MRPIVYIDVLFLTNFLINLVLLYVTGKLASIKISGLRVFISSVLGALYSVFMFFPNLSIFYTGFAKFLSALAIVAVAYNIKGIRLYLKTLGLFYVVTLCFGGGVFALFYFTGIGSMLGAVVRNGIIYFNLPWQLLFISIALSYIIISGVWKAVLGRVTKSSCYINLIISYYNKQTSVRALLDTGNSLHDPISNFPVIVTEYDCLKNILPENFLKAVKSDTLNFENISCISDTVLLNKLRIIPFSSLGKENGMLIGFRPDSVVADINETNRTIENVIIGICSVRLSKDGSFHALINPEIII